MEPRAPSDIDGQPERRVSGSERVKRPTISDFIIEKSIAIRPLLPMLNQACPHRILSNIVPFIVNRFRRPKETIKSTWLPSTRPRKVIKLVEPSLQPF